VSATGNLLTSDPTFPSTITLGCIICLFVGRLRQLCGECKDLIDQLQV